MRTIKYIYTITNTINNKKYVGLTNNIKRRRGRHFTDLRHGGHDNEHLQRSFNKYGEDKFEFEVVYSKKCSYIEIGKKEAEYIEKYDSFNSGYNMNVGGVGNNGFKSKFSKKDIFNIKATLENVPHSGGVLSEMFYTSRSSIYRISKNDTCIDDCNEYNLLKNDKKKEIFLEFDKINNIARIVKSRLSNRSRLISEDECLCILEYNNRHKRKSPTMARALGCDDSTVRLITKGQTNPFIIEKYTLLNSSQRDSLYERAKELFE